MTQKEGMRASPHFLSPPLPAPGSDSMVSLTSSSDDEKSDDNNGRSQEEELDDVNTALKEAVAWTEGSKAAAMKDIQDTLGKADPKVGDSYSWRNMQAMCNI
jgi:hypothetical protein